MGVWIEIIYKQKFCSICIVTPLGGVWIEIIPWDYNPEAYSVTPIVGVWIEIPSIALTQSRNVRHSHCGSVD